MLAAQYHAAVACVINYARGAAYVRQAAARSCGVTHAPIGSTAARCLHCWVLCVTDANFHPATR